MKDKFAPSTVARSVRRNRAFTLIELLVVIAIIAILAAMMYANDYQQNVPGAATPRWFIALVPYLENNQANLAANKVLLCPSYPDKQQVVCYVVNGG